MNGNLMQKSSDRLIRYVHNLNRLKFIPSGQDLICSQDINQLEDILKTLRSERETKRARLTRRMDELRVAMNRANESIRVSSSTKFSDEQTCRVLNFSRWGDSLLDQSQKDGVTYPSDLHLQQVKRRNPLLSFYFSGPSSAQPNSVQGIENYGDRRSRGEIQMRTDWLNQSCKQGKSVEQQEGGLETLGITDSIENQ